MNIILFSINKMNNRTNMNKMTNITNINNQPK